MGFGLGVQGGMLGAGRNARRKIDIAVGVPRGAVATRHFGELDQLRHPLEEVLECRFHADSAGFTIFGKFDDLVIIQRVTEGQGRPPHPRQHPASLGQVVDKRLVFGTRQGAFALHQVSGIDGPPPFGGVSENVRSHSANSSGPGVGALTNDALSVVDMLRQDGPEADFDFVPPPMGNWGRLEATLERGFSLGGGQLNRDSLYSRAVRFIAFLRKDAGSDYGVEFPDVPGCVSTGRTVDEARALAAEALAGHIAMLKESGQLVPAPSSMEALKDVPGRGNAEMILVELQGG